MISELAKGNSADARGQLIVRSYSVVEGKRNGISDIGKDGV